MSIKFSSTVSLAALIAALSFGVAQVGPLFAFAAAPAQSQMGPQYPQYPVETVAPDQDAQIDPRLQRQIVSFRTREAPGTIIIDTPNTHLYYVLGDGRAIRYGIGVGRDGFTWSGVKQVARKAEWPDWHPPAEMIARQPYLPRFVAGGPGNPLGARAMYLGGTAYRIHGTNDPTTIGKDVSSGCIRLTNEDVEDLYARVQVGAKVIVLPQTHDTVAQPTPHRAAMTSAYAPPSRAQRVWARIGPAGLY